MSYAEAVEDNIFVRRGGKGYSCSYYPPCHICGTPTYSQNYLRERKYTCDNCKTHAALSKLLKQDQRAIEKIRL